MPTIELVGHDDATGRDLFVLSLRNAADLPPKLPLSPRRFVCLVAWDARDVSNDEMSALARGLLDAGAVYISAWGPNSSRVHDVIDLYIVATMGPSATWHDNEPLADTLGFVLVCAYPDDAYADECRATLGIAIGSAEWAAEVRQAFSQPALCVRHWAGESD